MRKHKATIGSVSHGTMRDEDLIPTFLNEIQYLDPSRIVQLRKNPDWKIITSGLKAGKSLDEIEKRLPDFPGYWSEYTSELFDILNTFAPSYCHFGSSEGDGSDYGFWPDIESARESVEFISGQDGLDYPGRGFKGEWLDINDHGNVTLYCRNSKGNDIEIWSCV
jgi:hypothetical protein